MRKMTICIFILLWPIITKAHGMDAMAYFNLGIENRMTYKKINYFSRALELNPSLSEAYEKRGMLYYFQEKYELMIQDFQRFIEFVPTNASALRMLGIGYLKTGLYRRLFPASPALSNWSRNLPVLIPAERRRIGLSATTIKPYAMPL